ncbi:MAG: hypothetical protein AB8H03_20500 [Saprospiraceae bacterium]
MKNFLLLLTLFLIPIVVVSQKELSTSSVSIFENGTSLVEKEIEIDASKGKFIFEELPFVNNFDNEQYILFGNLWVTAPNNKIPLIRFFEKKLPQPAGIDNMAKLFQENIGHTVKVNEKDGLGGIKGELKMSDNYSITIKRKEKWIRIPINSVKNIQFEDGVKTTYEVTKTNLELTFEEKIETQLLKFKFLQKGITWTPNYFFEIKKDQKPKLNLRAQVINNLEDFENVTLNFLAGSSPYKHKWANTPSTTDADSNQESIPTSQNAPRIINMDGMLSFQKKKVTLKKGEQASFNLLDAEINFKEIYFCELKPSYHHLNNAPLQKTDTKNIVWHVLQFTNNTDYRLPAGSIFFLKTETNSSNTMLTTMNQNQLPYMYYGESGTIKMAKTSDIFVTQVERVIRREIDIIVTNNWGNQTIGEVVTIEATIDVKSNIPEGTGIAKLEIERIISGKLIGDISSSETKGISNSGMSFNPKTQVKWAFDLSKKENRIVYNYQVYVK